MKRGEFSKVRQIAQVFMITAALLLIGAGIFLGEHSVVFTKAANICMECIGIG